MLVRIVMKDCISRHQIANIVTLKKLLLYCISNIGSVFSYKSLGMVAGTNENTAKKYINILNDSYTCLEILFGRQMKNKRQKCTTYNKWFGTMAAKAVRNYLYPA